MKKFLLNTQRTQKFLKSLSKIYVIVRWEGFEVKELYFSGKCSKRGIPIVYAYDFTNEICGRYFLKEVSDVFDGWIYAWTTSESRAKEIAAALNEKAVEGWRNQ